MEKKVATAMKDLQTYQQGELREKIMGFEDLLAKQPGAYFGDSKLCPLIHKFTDGIYVREIFIPAGTHLVGKIHKHEHPNFLMSGTVQVVTETGGYETLKGPLSMISPPGTKRALRALTDLVWITVHHNPTNTQDLDEIEDFVIAPSYEEYQRFIDKKENFFTRIIGKLKHLKL